MTTKLLDLSGKIDQVSLSLYELFGEVAASSNIRFFVVGATARDTILAYGYGIKSKRGTLDMDIALRVSDWNEFQRLREALISTGQFAATKDLQKLLYRGQLRVDMLPFGEIANPNNEISWPPDDDITMGVLGFEDAYSAAQLVRLRANPPLDILFASPAGLAVMKFAAWADRPAERQRDAQDLAHIIYRYLDAGNFERLLEEHPDLLDVEGFDAKRAGARLLGRDMARIMTPNTKKKILEILEAEIRDQSQYRLIQGMMAVSRLTNEDNDRIFEEHLGLLGDLLNGIKECER